MSSPGPGFNHSFLRVTRHATRSIFILFYFLFTKFWSERHLLAMYRTTQILFGDMAHCTLQTWCGIKHNKISHSKKVLSISISNAHVERIFSIFGNVWADRRNRVRVKLVKSELCTKFNFDMTCGFSWFSKKKKQSRSNYWKVFRRTRSIRGNKTCFSYMWFYL
jgi:hypothetical protein